MADAKTMSDEALHGMLVGEDAARRETRRWALVGFMTLALSFGGSVAWSTLAPLSSAVVAQGTVKVESSRKKVQHLEGGVIQTILVKEGDVIKAGDVVVRMDGTRALAAHGLVEGGRDVALATLARLQAERQGLATIGFPASLLQRATGPLALDAIRTQESLFKARRLARAGEVDIIEQQIGSLRGEIEGFESQRRAKSEQIESLTQDLKSLNELDAVGMVEKTKLRAVERELARLKGEHDELASRIASTRTAMSEKELRKFQVEKAFQEEVTAELRKVQSEKFELAERENSTLRTLELIELRAPVDGTVTDMKVHTAGGVVQPGELLMEIVPSSDRLGIEARVLPQEIDRIVVGQSAGVKVHAFNSRTTPELNGRVIYVGADAATDLRTEMSYFVVKVEVSNDEIARLGGQKLQPGMQADIFIRTGERTFLGYLMQPLMDSFEKAWRER